MNGTAVGFRSYRGAHLATTHEENCDDLCSALPYGSGAAGWVWSFGPSLADIFVALLGLVLNETRQGFVMGTVATRGTSHKNNFCAVAEPFLQTEGLPFAEVLDAASIQRVFGEENKLGIGAA